MEADVIGAIRTIQKYCNDRIEKYGCKDCMLYDFCDQLSDTYWPFDWEVTDHG